MGHVRNSLRRKDGLLYLSLPSLKQETQYLQDSLGSESRMFPLGKLFQPIYYMERKAVSSAWSPGLGKGSATALPLGPSCSIGSRWAGSHHRSEDRSGNSIFTMMVANAGFPTQALGGL